MELTIGQAKLTGPVLIPSISSFETQGGLLHALQLQHAMSEPITLISAHDVDGSSEFTDAVAQFRKRGGVVFMDSGGYEASRIGRYVPEYRATWNLEKFAEATRRCEYDLVASFDIFIGEKEPVADFQKRLVEFLTSVHQFVTAGSLVPVIHIQDFSGRRVLSEKEVISLVTKIASILSPRFVAIPERELGPGLVKKRQLATAITASLTGKKGSTGLHVLGCGNPLSFAILADAGIAMADGLEWCRTLVGPNYHLHHFQQGGLIPEPESVVYNATADVIRQGSEHYVTRTLARNLHALQSLMRQVGDAMADGTIREFVRRNFGDQASSALITV